MKKVVVLGSTGRVGTAMLKVIALNRDEFEVVGLACCSNTERLLQQIEEFSPKYIYVEDREKRKAFPHITPLEEMVVAPNIDLVVFAMDGVRAIPAAFAAVEAKKEIAVANKEILVAAGDAFMALCKKKGIDVWPIDGEHSALLQCLKGEEGKAVDKLVLTASGGPFYKEEIIPSLDKAIFHPNHSCGKKVAINCSTLMNKGLEIIEAKHLFGIDSEKIDVVIHPQSVMQSMVTFTDGAAKAIFARPSLEQPAAYALFQGERGGIKESFDLDQLMGMEFYPKDLSRWHCLDVAFHALREGGDLPSYINGANEVLVERFCQGKVSWSAIGENLLELVNKKSISKDSSLEAVLEADKEGRRDAMELLKG